MSSKFKLSRRAALKGLGGVALSLPLLEAMLDSAPAHAQAALIPKRMVVLFGGHSVCAGQTAKTTDHVVPTVVGENYNLPTALMPLSAVKSRVSVVSGLKIPTTYDNGGSLPLGGKPNDFHHYSEGPLLSGVKASDGRVNGPTADQIAATFLAGNTTFKSLTYRVQVTNYINAGGGGRSISFRRNADGSLQEIVPGTSPRQAFTSLFGNFTAGLTPTELAQQKLLQDSRLSVVDRVKRRAALLSGKLGAADKKRLDAHLQEVQELEARISATPPSVQGICQKPMDPGADPAVGGGQQTGSNGNITYTQNLGYSGEEERAKNFIDVLHMALACDLTRVVALQLTMTQSFMNMFPTIGLRSDLHELSHGGFGNVSDPMSLAMGKGIAWHMKHFAYFVNKLASTPEGNGSMLDNTAVVYLSEGGFGYDPSSGAQGSPHSTDNMMVVVAGGAGGLKGNRHILGGNKHPGAVLLTVLKALGYSGSSFGEVTATVPELTS